MAVRYGFRRFGDDDDFNDLDVDEMLRLLADDYMESGDLDDAMDRLLREGFTTESGERVEGLRELLERTRARRRELEQQGDPSGEMARYRDWLEEIEAVENAELDALLEEAEASGDERRAEVTRDLVDQRRMQQDLMSERFAERVGQYQNYEFVSSEAREEFESMVGELERDVLNTYFEQSKEFLGSPDPEEMARLRDMMDALSTMIEQDRAGEPLDPTFDSFMEKFGDYFPGAESLEDVIRQMAERAAAAEAMFNSLSAEQQSELRSLFDQMMQNMEINFSMNRLVSNLRMATPELDWNRAHRTRGQGSGSFADATDVAESLGQLRDLEDFLGRSSAAQSLPEVDLDAVRRHLGDDAARHVARLQKAMQALKDQGFIDRHSRRLELTAKGVRQIGQLALRDLFAQLRTTPTLGQHREATIARGGDREETSKPWEPGEAFALHLPKTLRNAVLRQGPGTPVRLIADDFEVEEYEAARRSATVFAIDLSLSMAMRGNLVPAKKMVLALTQLIRSKFPRDFVAVVGFGERAMELKLEDVPSLTIDYNYGTNLQHALALSRHLLRNERGDRQVVVVTDGEPTAHLTATGEPFFSWPPVRETLEKTMAEVLRCTKANITINTFALDIERSQFPFVEQIAKVNGGRLFYTDVDELGAYALNDFVRHRRAG
ncbi:MAG: VWA domain-containing protein [Acidobacteriota bacterium]|nr:VWA domain-containing protein [Acidobacteriota bacterium]MDE3222309.1 VWA domain-containing protein [Acidobacteriota bacterium]